MINVVITTNIPAPYRVALYAYLQEHFTDYHFDIIYSAHSLSNREWSGATELKNSYFLHSKTVEKNSAWDRHIVHFANDTGKLLTTLNPDVVIAMEYNPVALQCMRWCKKHHRKLIHLTDGTLYSERNISLIQKISRKWIFRAADACIASSTRAKEKCAAWGVPEERIFVSLLTENLEQYQTLERTPVSGRLLYVGSMIERKGLDLLLDALTKVTSDYELRIVGNGTKEEQERLEAQSKELGIREKITFAGFLEGDALLQEYREADVFVFPTREDCFGLVLLEAAAAGVPIITSKYADGAYDIIEDGVSGMITDPMNVDTFAGCIDQLLGNAELKKRMSLAAKAETQKFAFEETTQGYINAITYVLGEQ